MLTCTTACAFDGSASQQISRLCRQPIATPVPEHVAPCEQLLCELLPVAREYNERHLVHLAGADAKEYRGAERSERTHLLARWRVPNLCEPARGTWSQR